jgi:hypothetical protein
LPVTEFGFDAHSPSKPFAKIEVNRIRGDVHQSAQTERNLKVLYTSLVRLVCFLSAERWFGIVFQERISPFFEKHFLALSHDIE